MPAKLYLSLIDQIEYKEASMQHQVKLLESAVYWYVTPAFIMNIIFIFGLGDPVDYSWSITIAENLLPLTINSKIKKLYHLILFERVH
jgi:hypothetical protein